MKIRDDIPWARLADETYRWMKDRGFSDRPFKPGSTGSERGFMRVDDGKQDSWVVHFGELFGVEAEDWGGCLVAMTVAGWLIGFQAGCGFYIASNPGDAATAVTRLMNAAMSLLGYAEKLMSAQVGAGTFDQIVQGYPGRIRLKDLKEISPLLKAAKTGILPDLEIALLEAKVRFHPDNDESGL
jgi:hypothetical protein